MSDTPKRRWFQFSLRTMFVGVTIFALWLGSEVKVVRERQSLIQEMKHAGASVATIEDFEEEARWFLEEDKLSPPEERMIPAQPFFWRRWLGDKSVVQVSGLSEGVLHERLCEVFPERRMATDVEFNNAIIWPDSTTIPLSKTEP